MASSVPQEFHTHQLENGLVLIAESMDWLESSAFTLVLPAGCVRDPEDRLGLANFVCEMVQRGCGNLDSRQFSEALDRLGADRSASVSAAHTSFGAATLADKLGDALALYADLVQRPLIPVSQIDDSRQICLHEIQSIEDDLAQLVMQEVRWRTYGDPWGRCSQGARETVMEIQAADLRGFVGHCYVPSGTILSVAGKIDWHRLCDQVQTYFGSWQGLPPPELGQEVCHVPDYVHLEQDSAQVHIAVAYPSIPYNHCDYFRARGAVGVLSDGMSSRLFTHVREERGLCYTVYATYNSLRHDGRILCYAATSTERAQETLDVMLAELVRLSDGIDESELGRLKARVKSALIMQQESSAARSGVIAGDWYHLGRVRTKEEITEVIDALTVESVNQYLAKNRPSNFTVVTLGAEPLEVNESLKV